jgi:hypothetical protein
MCVFWSGSSAHPQGRPPVPRGTVGGFAQASFYLWIALEIEGNAMNWEISHLMNENQALLAEIARLSENHKPPPTHQVVVSRYTRTKWKPYGDPVRTPIPRKCDHTGGGANSGGSGTSNGDSGCNGIDPNMPNFGSPGNGIPGLPGTSIDPNMPIIGGPDDVIPGLPGTNIDPNMPIIGGPDDVISGLPGFPGAKGGM